MVIIKINKINHFLILSNQKYIFNKHPQIKILVNNSNNDLRKLYVFINEFELSDKIKENFKDAFATAQLLLLKKEIFRFLIKELKMKCKIILIQTQLLENKKMQFFLKKIM